MHYVRLGYGPKLIENKIFKYYFWIPTNVNLFIMGIVICKQSIEQLGQWFTTVVRID